MIYIPWTLIPGLIAFGVAFVLWFFMMYYADHEKIAASRNPLTRCYLFWGRQPPAELLTPTGCRIRLWIQVCVALFLVSIIITLLVYGRR